MSNSKLNISILEPSHWDEAFRYESLARCAFNCDRGGGPNDIAEAGFYDFNIVELNKKGINAIEQIIDILINKTSGKLQQELIELRASLSDKLVYESAADLVDYLIKILIEDYN